MAEISKLGIEVDARGFGRAKAEMRGLTGEVQSGSQKMSRAFSTARTAVVGFIGALAVRQIAQFVSATISEVDALAKVSDRLGISVQALSEYQRLIERRASATSVGRGEGNPHRGDSKGRVTGRSLIVGQLWTENLNFILKQGRFFYDSTYQ